ncbi:MAG: chain-length determining protein [Prevotella sp.]|jgi:uncharacterized protein involved in exopolysaccharide biosynthesis|nr:chain-length determining protein [Prevotella sp.]
MSAVENNNEKEQEIDLVELGKKIWAKRRFVLKVSAIGFVAGVVVAFSLPKEYRTEVILAPESASKSKSSASMLAAMAGINLKDKEEALPPEIFPDIVASSPFAIGLFNVRVKDTENEIDTTLYAYIKDYQKVPWWSYIIGLPFQGLKMLFGDKKELMLSGAGEASSIIALSEEQSDVLGAIGGRIDIAVDKKTDVITLTTTMQSPEISAHVADTVIAYLQSYVISYRTEKARQDLLFAEKMFREAQDNYYKVQREYATFLDQNLNITSSRYKTKEESLKNELSLSYGLYNQMAQQLQLAKVKVQDMTPVYSVIQPAVVPIQASSPRKKLLVIGFVFLAVLGAGAWTLAKDFLVQLKK